VSAKACRAPGGPPSSRGKTDRTTRKATIEIALLAAPRTEGSQPQLTGLATSPLKNA